MNYDQIVLREQYSKMPLSAVILAREDLAYGPNEYHKNGTDPERDAQLAVLTEVLFEKMTEKKTPVQKQAQTA